MTRSDVCLYISIAGQDVPIGAALGLLGQWGAGQHVGSCGDLLWWRLTSLEPVVDQGHKEQHHAPHHRRHTSQGEGHCVIPKIVMQETCAAEVRRQNANGKIKTSALNQAFPVCLYCVYTQWNKCTPSSTSCNAFKLFRCLADGGHRTLAKTGCVLTKAVKKQIQNYQTLT